MTLILEKPGKRSARPVLLIILAFWSPAAAARGGEPPSETANNKTDPSAIESFKKSVRPILVERCQGCHGSTKQKGGLRLDSCQGALAGG
ncbi:MAG: c-type cytochrome domain-containing protein [Isosphaeraceae bacterium]